MFIISKETEKNNSGKVHCFAGVPFKIFEEHVRRFWKEQS